MKNELYLNSVLNVKEVVTALQLRTSPRFFSSSTVYLHLVINIYLHSPPSTPWRPGCPCPGPCSTAGTPSAPRSTWSRGRTSRTPATWHTAASHVAQWTRGHVTHHNYTFGNITTIFHCYCYLLGKPKWSLLCWFSWKRAVHNLTPAPCHNCRNDHLWTDEGKVELLRWG